MPPGPLIPRPSPSAKNPIDMIATPDVRYACLREIVETLSTVIWTIANPGRPTNKIERKSALAKFRLLVRNKMEAEKKQLRKTTLTTVVFERFLP
jgi:hypothetical protein